MKFSFISAAPNENIGTCIGRKSIALSSFPPLGVLYLATVLKEAGMEVSVLDQAAMGFTVDETVKWIEKESPDVLGLSALASSGGMAALLSSRTKQKNANIMTIMGNHYATFNSERIMKKYPSVDIVVRGEAEETFLELANHLESGEALTTVRGIVFRNQGHITLTPERPLIKDLDSLPFPNRKLISAEYHSIVSGANLAPKKFTSIASSRGCSFGCRFCSCAALSHNLWRARSVENTLEELMQLANEGYRQLVFVDDNFTLNPKRVINLCRAMQREKLNLEWVCEGRVDNCSIDMLREMVKAGLKVLYFGIENANQRILDYYNKKTTPQQAENAVRIARKAGVDVIVGSFILGASTETRREIQNTLNFARHLPVDIRQFSILGLYPGSEIWDEFEKSGLLNIEEYWETGIAVPEVAPTAVPLKDLKCMVNEAFFHNLAHPRFLFEQCIRTLKSPYRMSVVLSNLHRLREIRRNMRAIA